MIRLIIPLLLTAVMVFSIVDIATIDRARVRVLPKGVWIFIVIITSILGSILWFTIGRGRKGQAAPAGRPGGRARPVGPDDDPDFIDNIEQRKRNSEQEARIRDLERQLRDLDDDPKPEQ
jgi:hypothetical protein